MNVTLINYFPQAAETLIFTKHTRLTMTPSLFQDICAWPQEKKMEELRYMAGTIPSSWEFCPYVFLIEGVSRAYTHQQVRTRAGSYAQQSLRVTNAADFEYIFTEKNQQDTIAMSIIQMALDVVKVCYKDLLARGQAVEDARGILPTNIATNIVCLFNLRTLAELAKSRTGGRTQQEYIRVINAMLDAVLTVHPWAEPFLFPQTRGYFDELEEFAATTFSDFHQRATLLKIIDRMRKGQPDATTHEG